VAPQLSSGWQHNNSAKTRQAGWANEQSVYSLMSMIQSDNFIFTTTTRANFINVSNA